MNRQLVQNRYFDLDQVLHYTSEIATEELSNIEETYQSYKEELNFELKVTDKVWLEFQAGQCEQYGKAAKSMLYRIVKSSVDHPENSTAAANAITILKVMGISLSALDFEKVNINEADLSEAILYGANFAYASLKGVNLTNAILSRVNFLQTDLDGIEIGKLPVLQHSYEIQNYIITSDRNYLVTRDLNSKENLGNIYVWNLKNGTLENKFSFNASDKIVFKLSHLQKHVIVHSDNQQIPFFIYKIDKDTSSDESEIVVRLSTKGSIYSTALTTDGRFLFTFKPTLRTPRKTTISQFSINNIQDLRLGVFEQPDIEYELPIDFSMDDIKFSPKNSLAVVIQPFEENIYILNLETMEYSIINTIAGTTLDQIAFTEDEKQVIIAEGNSVYLCDLWDNTRNEWNTLKKLEKKLLFIHDIDDRVTHLQFIPKSHFLIYVVDKGYPEIIIRDIANNKMIASYITSNVYQILKGICSYCHDGWVYIGTVCNNELKFFKSIETTEKDAVISQARSPEVLLKNSTNPELIFSIHQNTRLKELYCTEKDVDLPIQCSGHIISKDLFAATFISDDSTQPVELEFVLQQNQVLVDSQILFTTEKVHAKTNHKKAIYSTITIFDQKNSITIFDIKELVHCYNAKLVQNGIHYIAVLTVEGRVKILQNDCSVIQELYSFALPSSYNPKNTFEIVLSKNFSKDGGYLEFIENEKISMYRIWQLNGVFEKEVVLPLDMGDTYFKALFRKDQLIIVDKSKIAVYTLSNSSSIIPKEYHTSKILDVTFEIRMSYFALSFDGSLVAFCYKNIREGVLDNNTYIAVWDIDKECLIETLHVPTIDLHVVFDINDNNEILLKAISVLNKSIRIWKLIDRRIVRLIYQQPVMLETDCTIEKAINVSKQVQSILNNNNNDKTA